MYNLVFRLKNYDKCFTYSYDYECVVLTLLSQATCKCSGYQCMCEDGLSVTNTLFI